MTSEDQTYLSEVVRWLNSETMRSCGASIPHIARVQGIPASMAKRIVKHLLAEGKMVQMSDAVSLGSSRGTVGAKYRLI